MTVSEVIVTWLRQYQDVIIETNHISDGSDKYGLIKSPNRDIKSFMDGSYEITEYYQFLAKQNGTSDYDRKDIDEWLEVLTYWVDDYPYEYEYPAIDTSRRIQSIVLTGCPYPMNADDQEILYQMSLKITYLRKREE
ncbi:MAG: hypothetical protein QM697_00110 [Lachnospiraceae bacterium]